MTKIHRLHIDSAIGPLENLLLAGLFVTQNFLPEQSIKITLPSSVVNVLQKTDLNRCFSDVLIDFGFRDEGLDIAVLPEDSFIFEVF